MMTCISTVHRCDRMLATAGSELSAQGRDRMERAMGLAAVPDDGEMYIAGTGMWHAGRQLRAASGVPVVWVSDRALTGAGLVWTDVAGESAGSGLQPFL